MYMIFWGPRELLVSRGKIYRFLAKDLPAGLLAALDAASPIPEEEARGESPPAPAPVVPEEPVPPAAPQPIPQPPPSPPSSPPPPPKQSAAEAVVAPIVANVVDTVAAASDQAADAAEAVVAGVLQGLAPT